MKFYNLGNENFETDCRTETTNMYSTLFGQSKGIVTQKYRNLFEKIPCNLMEKAH